MRSSGAPAIPSRCESTKRGEDLIAARSSDSGYERSREMPLTRRQPMSLLNDTGEGTKDPFLCLSSRCIGTCCGCRYPSRRARHVAACNSTTVTALGAWLPAERGPVQPRPSTTLLRGRAGRVGKGPRTDRTPGEAAGGQPGASAAPARPEGHLRSVRGLASRALDLPPHAVGSGQAENRPHFGRQIPRFVDQAGFPWPNFVERERDTLRSIVMKRTVEGRRPNIDMQGERVSEQELGR
jgi:hypothetical protein